MCSRNSLGRLDLVPGEDAMLPGMTHLLSIGEFSARCGLSPKALRLYAEAGLLVPAAVDSSNGYRYTYG